MAKLRIARPLWLDRAPSPPRRYPSLRGASTVEVAIVGGGITGAAVAYLFARAGISVAVVDAARVGRGSTAASTALLMQEPDADFRELAARYGPARAARMWDLSRDATRGFIRTLRRLKIPCDLERRDSVYYTTRADHAAVLAEEFEQRQRQGLGGRWLDAAALKRATGIDGQAGIRTRGNAQVDPFKACIGLLRAAERLGARVFEKSVVRRIDTAGSRVELRTRGGTLRANAVVVATGYATPEFKPLAGRFRLFHTYVVATGRIPAAMRRRLGLGDLMLWDTERPYHYARWTDGRLLLGGADRPLLPKRQRLRGAPLRSGGGPRPLHTVVSCARTGGHRLRLGGSLRDDPGQTALHRPPSPVSAPPVRARVRRERDDVRLPGRAAAAGHLPAPKDRITGCSHSIARSGSAERGWYDRGLEARTFTIDRARLTVHWRWTQSWPSADDRTRADGSRATAQN